jgi:muramoyltetrapeptide carboxypeptidase
MLAVGSATAIAAPAAARSAAPCPPAPATPTRPATVKPRHLAPGDLVGLVAPASLTFEASSLDLAVEQLEAFGFRVKVGAHALARHGYLAGTDAERASDLMTMFEDPDVSGIVCVRGGWGTPRLLPLLDYGRIAKNPKPLIGYSDITALLNAIHQQTGLVTFHGPIAASNLRPFNREGLRRVVMSTTPIGTLSNPEKEEDDLVNRSYHTATVTKGSCRGRLVGGNLTLVASLMGTPWQVDTEGAILLLEDVEEELYRIDRMLTQLEQGGLLRKAAGVAFGICTDCPIGDGPSFSLGEILGQHLGSLGVPVVAGLAFGHREKMLTLPIGLDATLDATAGTLSFDQSAVA